MFKPHDAYLLGYYGMQNTGDDALLYASAWAANNLLGCDKLKVSVFGHNPYYKIVSGQGKNRFRGQERLRHYKVAATSKRLIIGGGSVFHSERDIQLKRHLIGLANPRKSMAVGVSIGPFRTTGAEKACQGFLNECGFVGVRDQQSFDIATSLAPNANVKLTFDLAPALLQHPEMRVPDAPREAVAFNFCQRALDAFGHIDEAAEQQRIDKACALLTMLWRQTGCAVHLIDVNGHQTFGDQHVHQQIIARLPDDVPVTHVPYDANPLNLLQRLHLYKAVVGMRLHAMIFAYLSGTPTVSLHYHNKCQAWSQQIGQASEDQFDASDFCPLQVTERLEQILAGHVLAPSLPVEQAVQKSLSNWSYCNENRAIFSRYTALQQA